MRLAQRREIERIALGAFFAIFIHTAIFLAVEYGRFLVFPEYEIAYGSIYVELEEPHIPTVLFSAAKPTEAVPQHEEKDMRSAETPGAEPKPFQTRDTGKAANGVPTVPEATQPVQPAAKPQAQQQLPSQEKDATKTETNVYMKRETDGTELSIEMGRKSDTAKPAIRLPVVLPEWVKREGRKLEITLSFVVGKDGMLAAEPVVEKSSGYTDVDEAVMRSMFKWKFSNPSEGNYMVGKFTYRINP